MKGKKLLILCSISLSMCSFSVVSAETTTSSIIQVNGEVSIDEATIITNQFADIILAQLVAKKLSKTVEDTLTKEDILKLTRLDCYDPSVKSLAGIEILTNLRRSIFYNSNDITDLKPISKLPLTTFQISSKKIKDISSLARMTSLDSLTIVGGEIEDITPLKQMTFLTNLNLNKNKISDVSGLKNLYMLSSLDLNQNQITNISDLPSVTYLDLSNNNITDISRLKNLVVQSP